uniref:Uncharacterized protein n=1 Tax=Arundo donax TaxID=35708 RepID=A0A0A9FQD5_ARUDO
MDIDISGSIIILDEAQ